MKSCRVLKWLVTWCWLWGLIDSGSVAAAERPNVVLIIADDIGWGDYGHMGHAHIRTPHIDRLASESLVFTRGYVPSSLCRPSLATLLTGQYPHQHHVCGNDPRLPADLRALPRAKAMEAPKYVELRDQLAHKIDAHPRLPALLAGQGYMSLQTGKWWEGDFQRGGFTHGMSHGDKAKGGRHGDAGLAIGRQGNQPVFNFIAEAKQASRPFFVWYAPMLPHTPHNPPARLLEHYKPLTPHLSVAKYWAMCEWFDESVGDVLQHLKDQGLAENTIVIYVADNGWVQGTNDEGGATGAPRGKRSQYDGGLRTPITIRWPGHITPARDTTHPVLSLDIVPTLLTATQIEHTPASFPGVDLLAPEALAGRESIHGEVFEHDIADIDRPAASLLYRWVVSGDWKLIVPHAPTTQPATAADPAVELFQITSDPGESQNMAAANPEIVTRLQASLDDWWNGE